jgi:hypothetical protein
MRPRLNLKAVLCQDGPGYFSKSFHFLMHASIPLVSFANLSFLMMCATELTLQHYQIYGWEFAQTQYLVFIRRSLLLLKMLFLESEYFIINKAGYNVHITFACKLVLYAIVYCR